MSNGTWLKTTEGKDIYIVDYPSLLYPEKVYTEEELLAFDKCREFMRNFVKENKIEFIANGKKFI